MVALALALHYDRRSIGEDGSEVDGIRTIGAGAAIVVFCLCTLFSIGQGWAVEDDEEPLCPISIQEAITLEQDQIEHLFRERGLLYLAPKLASDLQLSVETYLSPRQSPGDPRDRALLFFIGNSEILCAMYWRIADDPHRNVFIIEQLAVSPADIVPLIDDLVLEMQSSSAGILRQAQPKIGGSLPRGASPVRQRRGRPAESILADLSQILFPGEIGAHVQGLASLTIIPCLNIGIVPFAAMDPDGDRIPLVETTVVNVEAELRHVYENRIFAWDGAIGSATVFGNPDAGTDPEWSFPRLPGAQREAIAVAERLGVAAVLGEAATPGRMIDDIREADYIHIAAHGLSSVDHPLDDSFLALTGGRLTARSIQAVDLRRLPLVVLSACQTGLGGPLDAGIVGLARGFVIAGALGTVATLWNVDDDVTALLMVDFVGNLQSMSPLDALRTAQQRMRALHEHPRYWSGFMFFGSRTVTSPG